MKCYTILAHVPGWDKGLFLFRFLFPFHVGGLFSDVTTCQSKWIHVNIVITKGTNYKIGTFYGKNYDAFSSFNVHENATLFN